MERFEEFARRKQTTADGATLCRWETIEDCHTPDQRIVGNDWSRALIDGDFFISPAPSADLPSTSLVFVRSREGNTVAKDPSQLGGGDTDAHVLYEGVSRVAADAVMAGAETIRGGRMMFSIWRRELVALRASLGRPRHPAQIVATLRGISLDEGLLFNTPELHVILLTVPGALAVMKSAVAIRPWISVVVMDDAGDLGRAFRQLRDRGMETISCVGGRTLAQALLGARLVQDLYLTTSPRSGGEPDTPIAPHAIEGATVVRKRGTAADAGVAFEHIRVRSA
jgi:riboflavin biosynthesis pyrimidine reductase